MAGAGLAGAVGVRTDGGTAAGAVGWAPAGAMTVSPADITVAPASPSISTVNTV